MMLRGEKQQILTLEKLAQEYLSFMLQNYQKRSKLVSTE